MKTIKFLLILVSTALATYLVGCTFCGSSSPWVFDGSRVVSMIKINKGSDYISYEYDSKGRMTKRHDTDNWCEEAYDFSNGIRTKRRGKSEKLSIFRSDAYGRIVYGEHSTEDEYLRERKYDSKGRILSEEIICGDRNDRTTYTWDEKGRLIKIEVKDSEGDLRELINIVYSDIPNTLHQPFECKYIGIENSNVLTYFPCLITCKGNDGEKAYEFSYEFNNDGTINKETINNKTYTYTYGTL